MVSIIEPFSLINFTCLVVFEDRKAWGCFVRWVKSDVSQRSGKLLYFGLKRLQIIGIRQRISVWHSYVVDELLIAAALKSAHLLIKLIVILMNFETRLC